MAANTPNISPEDQQLINELRYIQNQEALFYSEEFENIAGIQTEIADRIQDLLMLNEKEAKKIKGHSERVALIEDILTVRVQSALDRLLKKKGVYAIQIDDDAQKLLNKTRGPVDQQRKKLAYAIENFKINSLTPAQRSVITKILGIKGRTDNDAIRDALADASLVDLVKIEDEASGSVFTDDDGFRAMKVIAKVEAVESGKMSAIYIFDESRLGDFFNNKLEASGDPHLDAVAADLKDMFGDRGFKKGQWNPARRALVAELERLLSTGTIKTSKLEKIVEETKKENRINSATNSETTDKLNDIEPQFEDAFQFELLGHFDDIKDARQAISDARSEITSLNTQIAAGGNENTLRDLANQKADQNNIIDRSNQTIKDEIQPIQDQQNKYIKALKDLDKLAQSKKKSLPTNIKDHLENGSKLVALSSRKIKEGDFDSIKNHLESEPADFFSTIKAAVETNDASYDDEVVLASIMRRVACELDGSNPAEFDEEKNQRSAMLAMSRVNQVRSADSLYTKANREIFELYKQGEYETKGNTGYGRIAKKGLYKTGRALSKLSPLEASKKSESCLVKAIIATDPDRFEVFAGLNKYSSPKEVIMKLKDLKGEEGAELIGQFVTRLEEAIEGFNTSTMQKQIEIANIDWEVENLAHVLRLLKDARWASEHIEQARSANISEQAKFAEFMTRKRRAERAHEEHVAAEVRRDPFHKLLMSRTELLNAISAGGFKKIHRVHASRIKRLDEDIAELQTEIDRLTDPNDPLKKAKEQRKAKKAEEKDRLEKDLRRYTEMYNNVNAIQTAALEEDLSMSEVEERFEELGPDYEVIYKHLANRIRRSKAGKWGREKAGAVAEQVTWDNTKSLAATSWNVARTPVYLGGFLLVGQSVALVRSLGRYIFDKGGQWLKYRFVWSVQGKINMIEARNAELDERIKKYETIKSEREAKAGGAGAWVDRFLGGRRIARAERVITRSKNEIKRNNEKIAKMKARKHDYLGPRVVKGLLGSGNKTP